MLSLANYQRIKKIKEAICLREARIIKTNFDGQVADEILIKKIQEICSDKFIPRMVET